MAYNEAGKVPFMKATTNSVFIRTGPYVSKTGDAAKRNWYALKSYSAASKASFRFVIDQTGETHVMRSYYNSALAASTFNYATSENENYGNIVKDFVGEDYVGTPVPYGDFKKLTSRIRPKTTDGTPVTVYLDNIKVYVIDDIEYDGIGWGDNSSANFVPETGLDVKFTSAIDEAAFEKALKVTETNDVEADNVEGAVKEITLIDDNKTAHVEFDSNVLEPLTAYYLWLDDVFTSASGALLFTDPNGVAASEEWKYLDKFTTGAPVVSEGSESFDEEFLQSGTCGETVYWGLGESGTLYVYGNGKMYDFATTSEIPWYAYKDQIKSVEVLDGVTYIGSRAFRDTYVEKAKFASTVTATGTSLFNSASKLVSVDLGGNISHLNNYVFYNCDALKSIDLKGVKSVGTNTFASCGVLSSVAFYKGLTSIGASAFYGDSELSDLYYEGTADEWANVSIASGNTSLTALSPRGTVEGTCGDNLSWAIKGNNLIISGTGKMYDFASTSEIPWYTYKSVIEKVSIEQGITHIGSRAFRDTNITEVVIPEGVTSAGSSILNTCAKLKYVTLPSTLKAIPNYMLYNCDALESIDLSYVTSIGTAAFGTCGALAEIKLSSALKTVSASAFDASTKLADIYYDGTESQWNAISVSSTGNAPFKAAAVHYAEIPENVVALGVCGDSLEWVVDTDGVLTISGTGKMYDFATTSEIPWYAYKSQIKSLKIEEGIIYIGNRAFRDLSITSVVIPEGVVSTGTSIFNNCLKLAEVTLPSTLKAIANYTFNNCDALTSVDLSYAKTIGTYAFATCGVLSKVTLSKDLVSVAANAFSASTKLTDVYYDGTESDWANVSVASANDPLINATFHFAEDEEVITITQPDNLRYKYGQPIDLTGVVIESSTKGVILEVTGDYSVTGYNPFITTAQDITVTSNGLTAVITVAGFNPFLTGEQTGTISYGDVSIDVTIEIVKLKGITIASNPDKTVYAEGEELDLAGLIVMADYSDGSREEITDYTVSGYDSTITGEQTITVTYEDQTADFIVNVLYEPYIEISENSPHRTEFMEGEEFEYSGLEVVYHDEYGNSTVIYEDELTVDYENYTMNGSGEIFVYYGGLMTSYWVDVIYLPMPDMGYLYLGESSAHKTYFRIGEFFDYNGLEVYYDDGYGNIKLISNEDLTIDSGNYDSETEGYYDITIEYNGYNTSYGVEVIPYEWSIGIAEESSHRTSFELGEDFDASGLMLYMYDGSGYTYHKGNYTVSSLNYNKNVPGSYEIFVAFNGLQTSYWVNVMEPNGNYIVVSAASAHRTEFTEGEEFDYSGLEILYYNEDGSCKTVKDYYTVNYDNYDPYTPGSYEIFVYYDGHTTSYTVYVNATTNSIAGILIETLPEKLTYQVGEELDLTGMVVQAIYSDGTIMDITDAVNVHGFDSTMQGTQWVIVEYIDEMYGVFSEAFEVEVISAPDPVDVTVVVEHYLENIDGTYSAAPYETETIIAQTGTIITAADYEKEFDGFTVDFANSVDVTVSEDETAVLKIYYTRNFYNIVFDYGEAGGSYTVTYKHGTNMDLAAPAVTAPEGKYFAGWADAEGNLISTLTVPAYDITIYAQWAEIETPVTTYTVTFVDYDGTVLSTQEVEEGNSATAPTNPTRENYVFTGWDTAFDCVESDLTVTATYEKHILGYGYCGDEIKWTLYASGLLDLTGNGNMYDYSSETAPWYEYHSEITFVQIESNITTIGAYAFYNCENLTSVSSLENITSIGEHAFDGCVNLKEIKIPDAVLVGDGAFKGCVLLTQIPIPDGKTEIEEGEFEGFVNMTAIVIPEGVTTIGSRAFLDCSSAETISLPSTISVIEESAFEGCYAVKYVYYNGTKTDWSGVAVANGNDNILDNMYYLKFTVVFEDYDSTVLSTQVVGVGAAAEAPIEPSREGYIFTGWSQSFNSVIDDMVITAIYEKEPDPEDVKYTIVYNLETEIGSGSYTSNSSEVLYAAAGEEITITPGALDGYELNAELSTLTNVIAQDGSTVFYVYYNKVSEPEPIVTYTVTFMRPDGVIIAIYTVEEGASAVAPTAPALNGYVFTGWNKEFDNIIENTVVTALYVPVDETGYTVTFVGYDGTTVLSSQTVAAGSTVVIPEAPTVEGYEFGGWYTGKNGSGTQFAYGDTASESITLYAYYYEKETVKAVGISITKLPAKLTYYVGETLNISGIEVTVNYSDSSTMTTTDFTTSTFDSSTTGIKTITVIAEGFSAYFDVEVIGKSDVGTITVSTVTGQVGNTIDVNVSVAGNPGIASMLLNLHYDSNYLKLVGVKDGGILGATVHSDDLAINPYVLTWANDTASENITANGVIATLTFEVSEDTPTGHYPIMVSYDNDNYDIFDVNLNTVEFLTVDGGIAIIDHIIGDVNGDGSVNTLDRAVLSRYLSKWSGYDDINLKAADVNMDGRVNTLDRAILTRYLSKWSGYEALPFVK